LKIFFAHKNFKCISYLLLILFLACNLNSAGFNQCQAETAIQQSSMMLPAAEKEKTIAEIKKEFKEQNKENIVSPITVFANLFTLVIIMVALAWLYNKYGKNALSKALAKKALTKNFIKIVSTMPIGQNKFLHIVEVDNERMLIGATNTNISIIKDLKPDSPEEKVVSNE